MMAHSITESGIAFGALLAGGRGARLGGVDKGLLSCGDAPLAMHALSMLRAQTREVVIVANRNHARYAALHAAVIEDGEHAAPGALGPLGGIAAALAWHAPRAPSVIETQWMLCLPCDAWRLPPDIGARLLQAARAAHARAAYAVADRDAHYTCCLLDLTLLPVARTAAISQPALGAWLQAQNAAVARVDGDWGWSVNTPEELAMAQRQMHMHMECGSAAHA